MKLQFPGMLLLAGSLLVACGWPKDGQAQRTARVGFLTSPAHGVRDWDELFRRALARRGWTEGKNISFEVRSALGDPPNFARAAAELVRLKVDVIYADNAPATRAAYAATRRIPIVGLDFTNDPVAIGYAESYGRPGRNLTGFFLDAPEFSGKWLELLKAIVPRLSRIAVLWDPSQVLRTSKL